MPGNRIEVAKSGRSKCVTCNEAIAKGGVRLAEEYHDIGIPEPIHRFFHLKCAAAVHPELVASALQHVDHGVEFDRAEIEAKIAPAIARAAEARKQKYLAQLAEKDAKVKPIVVATDDTTNELLDQLCDDPQDPGTLAVVADQLQARGDIRGELIALQLAQAAGSPATIALEGDDDEETDAADLVSDVERRARRIAELMEKLAIPLDPGDKCVWGIGFIHRLELLQKNGTRLSALAPIWTYPSLRFLSELRLTFASNMDTAFIARLPELVPRSLRVLDLGHDSMHTLAGVPALVAQLPHLETLALTGKGWTSKTEKLAHPKLRRLDINPPHGHTGFGDLANLLPFVSPKSLPAVDTLSIGARVNPNVQPYVIDTLAHVATSLGALGWFKRPLALGWTNPERPVSEEDVAALANALGKKKLAKLDLTGTKVPLALHDNLAKLCGDLVAPNLEVKEGEAMFVEHTNKPEWGRGKVVRRKEGKVEVQFPKPIGLKVFKADAPFLKMLA